MGFAIFWMRFSRREPSRRLGIRGRSCELRFSLFCVLIMVVYGL